jgi:phage shock protein PspC (stress-responsive transcriptional regulator)
MERKMTATPTTTQKPGLFGVCSGIAEDFGGFDPEYLRAAFVIAMLANAYYVVGAYCALAVVVAVSRWAVPSVRKAKRAKPALVAETPAATQAAEFEYAQAA